MNYDEENFEEIDFSAPIDVRFAISGIIIMVISLMTLAFTGNIWLKYFAAFFFFSSIFIMIKKKKP